MILLRKTKLLYKINYIFFNSSAHPGDTKQSCISYCLSYLRYALKKLYTPLECRRCIFYEPLKDAMFCMACKDKEYNAYKKITKRNMKKRPKYFRKFIKKNLAWED